MSDRPPRPMTLTHVGGSYRSACVCGWSLTHGPLTVDLPALRASQRHAVTCDQWRAARLAEIDWAEANDIPPGIGRP